MKFASHHIPLYPAHRKESQRQSKVGRKFWGLGERKANPNRWYIEKASGDSLFWHVSIEGNNHHFEAINDGLGVIDEFDYELE